jgi:hypothetical protein
MIAATVAPSFASSLGKPRQFHHTIIALQTK